MIRVACIITGQFTEKFFAGKKMSKKGCGQGLLFRLESAAISHALHFKFYIAILSWIKEKTYLFQLRAIEFSKKQNLQP
jgi:hypothetical protein